VSARPAAAQVAVLTYLTDTDERNAALRVLPGSHRGAAGEPFTLSLRAGDAVALDYRLLHGTHANATPRRRDCLILNFAPAWSALPEDIRGHLIQHPALPGDGERAAAPWLPRYDGPRRDLPLNRTPRTAVL
jgi:ectoine hydroxylase-related dioxygenase (phytanoyl-CoA dioxygenase family)